MFREIQRVLLASSGPVNWELARQVGIAVATWGQDDPLPTEQDRSGLAETVRAAELAVADFTGLSTPSDVATVEALRRAQWVETNIRSLSDLLDPVAARLAGVLGGPGSLSSVGTPDDLMQAVLGRMMPLLLGAQVGAVLGNLGQRVLGQFDLAVPRPAGSLCFVVPNIARFERDWSLPPVEFRAWVALHEVTHRFEFGRPWVRPHFIGLVKDLVEHAEIDLADPEALSKAFDGVGNFFGHASSAEQGLRIARVQAFMAAAEGYGDHVMDRLGRSMLPSYVRIDEALRRHRDSGHTDQALERLLGLEMKREQYRLGDEFCARVADLTDEATLARMWDSAESLPSMPELEEATLWLSRMA